MSDANIWAFTCPCGRVFHCAKAAPGEKRGVCARCGVPVSEEMEQAAVRLAPVMKPTPEQELARLRTLIRQAEYANKANGSAFCPWCGAEDEEGAARHTACPAFTPEGNVR
jgi:hypothetical protein